MENSCLAHNPIGEVMSYMVFTIGDGDQSKSAEILAAVSPLMKSAGASYVRGSVTLTGDLSSKGVVSSIWDNIATYFEARAGWMTNPDVVAALTAAGVTPIMTNVGEIIDERGECDGDYTVAVAQTATDHSPEATQRVMDAAASLVGNGVNGIRAVRGVAAGQATGTYLGIFYVDSLDAYLTGIKGLYADPEFQAAAVANGLTVVDRSFSRKTG